MKTIQKPKRMWQKKKDYNKKKLIRKIQRRNKTSFDGGKDESYSDLKTNRPIIIGPGLLSMFTPKPKGYKEGKDRSYQDWKTKISKYKHIDIDHDNTFDYEGFYNSDPDNAYRFLNDDPTAHFDDTYKTVYHPTFSDLSIYSGKVDPRFNPEGLKGGHWVNDHKYLSPKQSPILMDERIGYLGEAEDNGVQLRTPDDKPIWLDDGTRWDGVLPQVIVKPNYQRGKDKGNNKQNWFTRMAIGAAFNENPAVMTAAGWHKDSRGNWKQKRTAATNKLADNLETISMMADGTGSIDLIKSAGKLLWNAIRHPVRTAKQVKTLGNVAKNVAIRGKKYTVAAIDKSIKGNETLHKITKPIVAKKRTLKLQDTIDRKISDFKMPKTTKSQKPINQTQEFKSELDWSPESWFSYRHDGKFTEEDAQILKSHVPEYLKIERDAKLNGTWLKNPDGSDFIGDGREWVMLNSKNGQKLNPDYFYNGVRGEKPFDPEYNDEVWGSDKQAIAATYFNRKNPHSEVNKLYYPKNAKVSKINAGHRYWGDINYEGSRTTTDIAKDDLINKGADVVKIEDVLDLGPENTLPIVQNGFEYGTDYVLKDGLVRKSILGNNGNLDFSNKNIYKALLPLLIGTKLSQENHNSGKDIHIKKANRGKFTKAANEHNMGVQEFARQVLSAPKGKYSPTLRKRANFARNFAH